MKMGKSNKGKKEKKEKPIQHVVERVAIPGRVPFGEKLSGDVILGGTKVHVIGKHKIPKNERKTIITTITRTGIPHADEKSLRIDGLTVIVKGRHRPSLSPETKERKKTEKERKRQEKRRKKAEKQTNVRESLQDMLVRQKREESRKVYERVSQQNKNLMNKIYSRGFPTAFDEARISELTEMDEKVLEAVKRGDYDEVQKSSKAFSDEIKKVEEHHNKIQERTRASNLRIAKRDLESEIHEMKHREPGYGTIGEEGAPWERAGNKARVKMMEQYVKDIESGKEIERPDLGKVFNDAHNAWWADYNAKKEYAVKEDEEYWRSHRPGHE
jgi:hypothetical protein